MKAPRMTKALSFLMALIFCIYLVPTEVLAAEVKGNALASASTYARDYDSVDSPDIVSEIVSSRDEYQKEYLLSNGQHLLTVYPTAVHYADENGEWQEIDNTLRSAPPRWTGSASIGTPPVFGTLRCPPAFPALTLSQLRVGTAC